MAKLNIRKIAPYIPNAILYPFLREQLDVSAELPKELTFGVAQTKSELEAAYRILHDSFVDNGFMKPDKTGMRITKYFALPSTTTLVAKWNGQVIGTLSIVRKTGLGLPVQSIFDISHVEAGGYTVAEVSSLAIDKNFRFNKGAIFLPLCKYFYHFASQYMGIERVVIAVNPSMADFYRGFLFFETLNQVVVDKYDFANGAPAVGLWADFSKLRSTYQKVYGPKSDKKNLYKYFTSECSSNFEFPKRDFVKTTDPVMSPDLFRHFFIKLSSVYRDMSDHERDVVERFYPYEIYKNTMHFKSVVLRKDYRFMTNTEGEITGQMGRIKIVDFSSRGLKVIGPAPKSQRVRLRVQVAANKQIELSCQVRWIGADQNSFGLQLEDQMGPFTAEWNEFIHYHQFDFRKLQSAA